MKTSAKRTRRILGCIALIILALLLWNSCTPAAAPAPVPAPTASAVPNTCETPSETLPFVDLKGKEPALKFPAAAPSSNFIVKTCRVGTGEKVTKTQAVTVRYVVGTWEEKKTLETVWSEPFEMPFILRESGTVWEPLIGKTVGTQMLVSAPPGDIPTELEEGALVHHTLVYYIEIVGVQPQK